MPKRLVQAAIPVLGTALALLPSIPVPASGQERGEGWTECRTSEPGHARILGRLIPLQEELPGSRVIAWLEGEAIQDLYGCRVEVRSPGTFEYRGLPPGAYRLRYSNLGLGRSAGIPLTVGNDSLIVLDLPQYRNNLVQFCLESPDCAPILTRKPRGEMGVPEPVELSLLGHRLALALATEALAREPDAELWAACVPEEAPEGALKALSEVYPYVAPQSECAFREDPEAPEYGPRTRWFHEPSSRRAFTLAMDGVTRDAEGRIVMNVSYYVASLWAAGWECEIREVEGRLFPGFCRMSWIS